MKTSEDDDLDGGCVVLAATLAEASHLAFGAVTMAINQGRALSDEEMKEIQHYCGHALKFCGINPSGMIAKDSRGYWKRIKKRHLALTLEYESKAE